MAIILSRRLQALADAVPDGAKLVDVGTDHAYIPIYLTRHARIQSAIATDVADGPIRGAKRNVAESQLLDKISVRQGDGLQTIAPGEVDTILIAGMGGGTAAQILRKSPEVVKAVTRLIIQPMNAGHQIRRWLDEHGWSLVHEDLIVEDGRLYEYVVAARSGEVVSDAYRSWRDTADKLQFAYAFGPLLLADCRNVETAQRLRQEVQQWQRILTQMEESSNVNMVNRQTSLRQQCDIAESWLTACGEGSM